MQDSALREDLRGVIAFPVTPFQRDLSLDLAGLRRNLHALMRHPIAAIVAAAGTGEFHSLSPAEHVAIVKATVQEVAGRVPVLSAVGINAAIATDLVRQHVAAGVSGLLVLPPYYASMDDEGVLAYYKSIADAAPDHGFIIYTRDWFNPSPAQVERLANAIPNLIGLKDGQADLRRYQAIRQRVGDRLHWIGGAGDDMVPGYYSIGIRAYTSSIANIAPRLSLHLHELASNGHASDLGHVMNELIVPLYALRVRRKGYEVSAMKSLMDAMGLAGGPVRPPLVDLRPDEVLKLESTLESWRMWL
jgi:5-dehydro-4-deoxyglucarate dehydratase